jgi:hypothetical protein
VKKKILALFLVMAVVLVLTACSDDNEENSSNELPSESEDIYITDTDISGTWEDKGENGETSYTFSGNTFTRTTAGSTHVDAGTYSLSDNEIELICECPEDCAVTGVYRFRRTENTITIGGTRYTRQQ